MERITSRHNPVVKEFRALADRARSRQRSGEHDRILLDGAHLLEDAIAADVALDVIAIRDDLDDDPVTSLAQRAAAKGARLIKVPEVVLSAMSPVRQPSGIVAIARRSVQNVDAALERPPQLVLMLADIQDPGNVGAIVRVADACGATGIVTSAATADPFGWKALRGAMGSSFRIPIAAQQPLDAAIIKARQQGIRIYATVPRHGTLLPQCDLRSASAVLLGGEGAGLPDSLVNLADACLTVPMRRGVESLNVATAAALVVYEARRQRGELAS